MSMAERKIPNWGGQRPDPGTGIPPVERLVQHALAYGKITSDTLLLKGTNGEVLSPYTEEQCCECPHGNVCCDTIVAATPFEAMGILAWIRQTRKDFTEMARAIRFRVEILAEHFKQYAPDAAGQGLAIVAWSEKKLKCVFYDSEAKRCGVYPVRPVACRLAFGQGDCTKDGVRGGMTHPAVTMARVTRVRIHRDLQNNMGELTSLCGFLLEPSNQIMVDESDRKLLNRDPATLTDMEIVFGLDGPPMNNPVAEVNHGSAQRSGETLDSARSGTELDPGGGK